MDDKKRPYDHLLELSIEELEELLIETGEEGWGGDEEYVDALVAAVVQKEHEHPTGRIPNADQAWLEFQLFYNTPERKKHIQHLEKDLVQKES